MELDDIMQRPVITEKSMKQVMSDRYTFAVNRKATKIDVRRAVKTLYNVDAMQVQTIAVAGKRRRVGRRRTPMVQAAWKKAIITLKPGQKIDLFTMQGTKESS